MQPKSPELVVSIGDPQVSQTCALLLMAGIATFFLCGHRLSEMAQLPIHIPRIGYCAADFFPQNSAISRAQTGDVAAQCRSQASQSLRHFFIGDRCACACTEMNFERIKKRAFARDRVFLRQPLESLSQK